MKFMGELCLVATHDHQSLAKTVLAVMISCMFGGTTSISTMLHIKKSNSPFLYKKIRLTIDAINQTSGEVKVTTCDGNRKITKFFSIV